MEGNQSGNVTICNHLAPFLEFKLALVVVVGSTLSLISLAQNSVLVVLFLGRTHFRDSHHFYLGVLAFTDAVLALAYALLMPVQVLMEWHRSVVLSAVWHSYVRPVLTLSQAATTFSAHVLVVASLERMRSLRPPLTSFPVSLKKRLQSCFAIMLFCSILRGTLFYELEVQFNPACHNHNRFQLTHSSLGRHSLFACVWTFYIRNFFSVLLPFALVLSFNVTIVSRLKQLKRVAIRAAILRASLLAVVSAMIEENCRIRQATRVLVATAALYLISNCLNVLLTVWEHVSSATLQDDFKSFYVISADMVTFLTIFTGAVRLELYVWVNPEIWSEIKALFHSRKIHFLRTHSHTAEKPTLVSSVVPSYV